MTDVQPTRSIDGVDVPIPGTWVIDPLAHQSGLRGPPRRGDAPSAGRFRRLSGQFTIAERPEDSSVEVTIEAASIDTNHPVADDHLRGENYLDVANHPELTFRSTKVEHVGGDRWEVTGDLTIKGVARPIVLDATLNGVVPMPYGSQAKLGFTATGAFDRRDYGMDKNIPLPGGGVVVGNEVRLTLDVEADLPSDE